jgi:hypothetical protein
VVEATRDYRVSIARTHRQTCRALQVKKRRSIGR